MTPGTIIFHKLTGDPMIVLAEEDQHYKIRDSGYEIRRVLKAEVSEAPNASDATKNWREQLMEAIALVKGKKVLAIGIPAIWLVGLDMAEIEREAPFDLYIQYGCRTPVALTRE